MTLAIWLAGFAVAFVLLTRRLKIRSDHKGERIVGAVLMGLFSWAAVLVIVMIAAYECTVARVKDRGRGQPRK